MKIFNLAQMVRKILDKKPGIFRDSRFQKWDYDEPEDYPTFQDKNDVGLTSGSRVSGLGFRVKRTMGLSDTPRQE
jgi:hypothetical protein